MAAWPPTRSPCASPVRETPLKLAAASGLSLVLPVIGPLLDHPPVRKPADAVLAMRPVANLALAAAPGAKDRGRVGQRPRALRADDQDRKHDYSDRSPHAVHSFAPAIGRTWWSPSSHAMTVNHPIDAPRNPPAITSLRK